MSEAEVAIRWSLVATKHPLDEQQIERLWAGVVLHDDIQPVAATASEQRGEWRLRLAVSEGRCRHVKRMFAAAGNRIEALQR